MKKSLLSKVKFTILTPRKPPPLLAVIKITHLLCLVHLDISCATLGDTTPNVNFIPVAYLTSITGENTKIFHFNSPNWVTHFSFEHFALLEIFLPTNFHFFLLQTFFSSIYSPPSSSSFFFFFF